MTVDLWSVILAPLKRWKPGVVLGDIKLAWTRRCGHSCKDCYQPCPPDDQLMGGGPCKAWRHTP